MTPIQSFHEIIAWQKAHQLVLMVYEITDQFPKHEQFCLIPQIRRCAISIPSNIAEGHKRKSQRDSDHFYNIAEGSLEELKYQLLLARDLNYLTADDFQKTDLITRETGKLLYGWRKSQK